MEELEQEDIGFDLSFEVEALIYAVLKTTISHSIDEEVAKDTSSELILGKELMLKNILARNIDGLENEQYITIGPQGKLYLCGGWLMRPVFSDGKMIPMMEHIKTHMDTTNIVFFPEKTGIGMRKEMWFAKNNECPSYDLPKDCKIESSDAGSVSAPGMMGGPPPGMGRMPPMAMPPLGAGGSPPHNMPPQMPATPQANGSGALAKKIEETVRTALRETVREEIEKNPTPPPVPKESLIQNVLERNIASIKNDAYLTEAPNGTIYLCGEWLVRPVTVEGETMLMIGYLKSQLHEFANIVYIPEKTGTALRQELGLAEQKELLPPPVNLKDIINTPD